MDVFTGVLLLLLGAAPVMTATKNPVVETLHNTNATITAPEDPSGGSSYAPDARHLWILDMQQSDVNIEVTVQELDLGLPYTTIHETVSMVNYTEGDFLLIGAGPDILQGNEVMFYGSRRTPKKVVVRSGVGHIFFYSTQSITEAKGFIINYTMTVTKNCLWYSASSLRSQERYEQAQKDRINDQRRRSSGDISILGVGGSSLASQGSRSSRRYTMPFPKPARDEVDHGIEEEDEEEVDTTGFIYYDPDQSITDPAQFGLGGVVSEFTRKGQGSHQYTNKAFVTDEEAAADIQRASFADDSDTDSDNGGALSFRPSRTEMAEDVLIKMTARGPWETCSEDCTAYNVICTVGRQEGDWVSEKQLLDRLFTNTSLHHHWDFVPGSISVSDV
ncbi:hypothetical protein GWK47_029335 [Chionoecetes opilio]|uniref:Uncharacterized protein n=1 Tax=Chionoecetes opilio TaxID=41210 RepID=A0A8J4YKG4_CHIOP|nr:hypothetical protein GWK47_029335 [Chionoecetes opilio]